MEAVPTPGRSKRIYVMWGVALFLLLALGLVCWKIVPVWKTCAVVEEYDSYWDIVDPDPGVFVAQLGGPDRAVHRLDIYLGLPATVAGHKSAAVSLMVCCGDASIEPLTRALENNDPGVRLQACQALGYFGPKSKDAVPALIGLLGDRTGVDTNMISGRVQTSAARALGAIGKDAFPAIAPLAQLTADKDPAVRQAAAEALKKIKAAQEQKK